MSATEVITNTLTYNSPTPYKDDKELFFARMITTLVPLVGMKLPTHYLIAYLYILIDLKHHSEPFIFDSLLRAKLMKLIPGTTVTMFTHLPKKLVKSGLIEHFDIDISKRAYRIVESAIPETYKELNNLFK